VSDEPGKEGAQLAWGCIIALIGFSLWMALGPTLFPGCVSKNHQRPALNEGMEPWE